MDLYVIKKTYSRTKKTQLHSLPIQPGWASRAPCGGGPEAEQRRLKGRDRWGRGRRCGSADCRAGGGWRARTGRQRAAGWATTVLAVTEAVERKIEIELVCLCNGRQWWVTFTNSMKLKFSELHGFGGSGS